MDTIDNLIIYLNKWLKQFEKDEKIALKMIELQKQLEWEKDAISKLPKSLLDNNNIQINNDFYKVLLDQFQEKYPITEEKDEGYIAGNIEIVASSSSTIFKIVKLSELKNQKYLNELLISKEEIDNIKRKIEKIAEWFNTVNVQLKNEFDESIDKYYLKNENQNENYIIGISMRNLIEHLKGFLWTKVKNRKSQKCSMKIILNDLKDQKIKLDMNQIEKINNDFKDLHKNLTQIAKNQDNLLNIKIVFNEYINIIYTIKYFLDL